jgi:hypothetical protein
MILLYSTNGELQCQQTISRQPAFQVDKMDPIAAFDPFQPNLKELQLKDQDLQAIFLFLKNGS